MQVRQPSVTYLGHRIDRQGLHPIEKNVNAVMEAPRPRNVSELRSLHGMITFYARFLPNMATVLSPLYQLMEKPASWEWREPQQSALEKAK